MVLTTTPTFTAKYLLEKQDIWKTITHFKEALPIQPWHKVVLAQYSWRIGKRLRIPPGTRTETASAFYQLKLGHGYNKAYLFRIGKTDHPFCSCGAKQTLEHLLLSCKWLNTGRKILQDSLGKVQLTLPLLLHTKQGIKATLDFISRTKVGTRRWHLGQPSEDQA
ncbi:hypothetical protein BU25DRAFT_491615 [Macroventuria anomochaeta]|uniref:Uncharacterized protein n=1 Tax=Macroventuria anomochaeta TaxID=301207 RepID=A0ACB6S0T0_9PLEO|nr:uncharacterized protein BU25DRAFT_491615 [Macroventuria anomochaeta]KAF2627117.1 hypothetical protein BU25DRAFT_491615 [Macroventuria anomochaeta]